MRHVLTLLGLLLLTGSSTGPISAQIVRGQVVDSISRAPVAGATLALLDSSGVEIERTVADEEGRFLLRAPGAGQYRLRVAQDTYRASTFPPFTLGADEVKAFMLLLASLTPPEPSLTWEQMAAALCRPDVQARGQGILTGVVRDAVTGTPVADAQVTVSWPDVSTVLAELVEAGDLGRVTGEVSTDSSGVYLVCGVPSQVPVVVHAVLGDHLSDFVEERIDSAAASLPDSMPLTGRNVVRRDLELASADGRTAAVRGVVMDAASLQPIMGATVQVSGTGLRATTGSDGFFELTRLPAGPVSLAARRLGFSSVSHDVDLLRGETVSLPLSTFRLEELPVGLPPVVVQGEQRPTRRPLAEFWERRRSAGGGAFITRAEFEKQGNPQLATDVLRTMQGIRVVPWVAGSGGDTERRRWSVTMQRGGQRTFRRVGGGGANPCPPLFFIDRQYIGNDNTVDIDRIMPLINVEAIEAYGSAASLPPEFNRAGSACGVIAFWTR
jgi:hypothetical protein